MRLTTDLINSSVSYINCLKERELDLRGQKLSAIENMGAAQHNDVIDLTDNDIGQLGNFPIWRRLRGLLLGQNRITNIQANIASNIPNVNTIVLSRNRIAELADLEPLQGLKKLEYLAMNGNPVTSKDKYRLWVISRLPSVRFLDYQKVRQSERETAFQLFGTPSSPTDLAKQILTVKSAPGLTVPRFANGAAAADKETGVKKMYTQEEQERFRKMVGAAKTVDEVARLEKDWAEGRIPSEVLRGDAMEE
ncbi:U2 small nuclear ribonucleoprotein A [Polyplosphaeria fusca]|uniref:U2 small nuclear ribonucleoprotein A' n=1 Tax=Polyplosphaeria fusca TaxID=682080 RepID=A0A9P4QKG6_9PLEO|nr:U2 small nuclear ribonucleoprotein A [Polyplosphaeria fusca]